MDMRLIWVSVSLFGFLLCGCGKKDELVIDVDEDVTVVAEAVVQVEVLEPPMTPAERAEMHGFARYLPQDAELVLSIHDGAKLVSRLMASKLVGALNGSPADMEDVEEQEVEPVGVATLMGAEFTLAIGAGGMEDILTLAMMNRRSSYYTTRRLVGMLDNLVTEDGEGFSPLLLTGGGCESVDMLVGDELIPAGAPSGLELFSASEMPPIYLAFRVVDEVRDASAQQIGSMLDMLTFVAGPDIEHVKVPHGDSEFTGYKLPGGVFGKLVDSNREYFMGCGASADKVDALVQAIDEKSLTVMTGVVGEYVVLFVGNEPGDFRLVENVAESLLAGDAMQFADSYKEKELAAVMHVDRRVVVDMFEDTNVLLADMASGLRDGLAVSENLGETRSLQVLLDMVAEREQDLLSLVVPDGLDLIGYHEDGFKLEAFGGQDSGMFDWEQPNRLSSLGSSGDVAMFLNYHSDAAYDEKARAYFEVLLETLYAGAMKTAELPIAEQSLIEFRQGAAMFDAKLRDDFVQAWDAISNGFGGGLGLERAWVLDMNGEAPALPGVPQEVVDEAKFPRLSMVAPVVDRAKLGESWGKLNTSLTRLMASAGELAGNELPMQKPLSSEKDGFTTWFIAVPFINDDFVPSVTVDDEWFAASTSKNQAVDLLTQAAAGGEAGSGCRMRVDFKPIHKYAMDTLEVLSQHMAGKGVDASDIEQARTIAEACFDLDRLDVWVRREAGRLRSSIHLMTR